METSLRLLATILFWSAGIAGVLNFAQVVRKVKALGLPCERPVALGVIVLQLGGAAAVVFNPWGLAWVGAVSLAGFTLLTIPFGHAFWTMEEPCKTEELHIAIEHLTVVGGLLALGWYSAL